MCYRVLLMVILCLPVATKAFCSGYDACPFVYPQHHSYRKYIPAPQGQTPFCASPGLTFCDRVDDYPKQLVKSLIQKMEYNFDSLLRDESRDSFGKRDPVPYGVDQKGRKEFQGYDYSPPQFTAELFASGRGQISFGNTQIRGQFNERRLPSFTTKAPSFSNRRFPALTTELPFFDKKFSSLPSESPFSSPFFDEREAESFLRPDVSYYNPADWFKKFKRSNQSEGVTPVLRSRRQANNSNNGSFTISLCPTRLSYITPKAALNNGGTWKYIVNLNNEKYTQFVRTELCASSKCSSLCSLPSGYSSKCEQKYVQKRLVALNDDGSQIYTDVFWFPHGCVCEFSLSS